MKCVNNEIRRQDRVLNEEEALDLLAQTEYGILSMIDENGLPYGIPVNHVWDKQNSIYIHCAPEGKKLRAIKHHPNVLFALLVEPMYCQSISQLNTKVRCFLELLEHN